MNKTQNHELKAETYHTHRTLRFTLWWEAAGGVVVEVGGGGTLTPTFLLLMKLLKQNLLSYATFDLKTTGSHLRMKTLISSGVCVCVCFHIFVTSWEPFY